VTDRLLSAKEGSIRSQIEKDECLGKGQMVVDPEGKIFVAAGVWVLLKTTTFRWCQGPNRHRSRHGIFASSFIIAKSCEPKALPEQSTLIWNLKDLRALEGTQKCVRK